MTPIPLEDNAEDILNKAMRGWGLAAEVLSNQTGVSQETIAAMRQGEFDSAAAQKLAPALQLHAPTWIAIGHGHYAPLPVSTPGLFQFRNTDGMCPNFYLIWHQPSDTAVIFDTGDDVTPLLEKIAELGCTVAAVMITHTHPDHIACLDRVRARFPSAPVYSSREEPVPNSTMLDHGRRLHLGGLEIECRTTKGHSRGGMSFVVFGMQAPVVVVGDALFAGSMGGGMVSWTDALETNRNQLFSLSDDSIVCPGHGPLTTIGSEKRHNPFYPEFKS